MSHERNVVESNQIGHFNMIVNIEQTDERVCLFNRTEMSCSTMRKNIFFSIFRTIKRNNGTNTHKPHPANLNRVTIEEMSRNRINSASIIPVRMQMCALAVCVFGLRES